MLIALLARPLVPLAVAIAMVLTLFAAPVDAAAVPTLRLFVASSEVTLERNSRESSPSTPGFGSRPCPATSSFGSAGPTTTPRSP